MGAQSPALLLQRHDLRSLVVVQEVRSIHRAIEMRLQELSSSLNENAEDVPKGANENAKEKHQKAANRRIEHIVLGLGAREESD